MTKDYYLKNRERLKQYSRDWAFKNRAHLATRCKAYRAKNRERLNANSKRWRENNKEKYRKYNREYAKRYRKTQYDKFKNTILKCKYGITFAEYSSIGSKQGWVCAICKKPNPFHRRWGRPTRLAVDHHHSTNAVRGLLCHTCNNGLGCFKDDIALMELAVAYLKNHDSSSSRSSGNPGKSSSPISSVQPSGI